MMSRQTFYISKQIAQELKNIAHKHNKKISSLVNEALRKYLASFKQGARKQNSLLAYAGKIKSFQNLDPIQFQKKIRDEWEK